MPDRFKLTIGNLINCQVVLKDDKVPIHEDDKAVHIELDGYAVIPIHAYDKLKELSGFDPAAAPKPLIAKAAHLPRPTTKI